MKSMKGNIFCRLVTIYLCVKSTNNCTFLNNSTQRRYSVAEPTHRLGVCRMAAFSVAQADLIVTSSHIAIRYTVGLVLSSTNLGQTANRGLFTCEYIKS